MSRANRPNRGEKKHPGLGYHVLDFRKKLWLLFLLHEAMHNDHQALHRKSSKTARSLFPDEPLEWFKDGLFKKPRYVTQFWPNWDKRPSYFGDERSFLITYENLLDVYDTTWEHMLREQGSLLNSVVLSRINRRFGVYLDEAGRWSSKDTGPFKNSFEKHMWAENQVSSRILYRLVRGFFMLPSSMKPSDDSQTPLNAADSWGPEKASCWGTKDVDYVLEPPTQNFEDGDWWCVQQKRAIEVFRTFCGRDSSRAECSERDVSGKAIGAGFAAFREAVKAYYLAKDAEIDCCGLPPFFTEHQPLPAPTAKLSCPEYDVEGDGKSAFRASLKGTYKVSDGCFEVYGAFDPPEPVPEVKFTCLEVHTGRDINGARVSDLDRGQRRNLPRGCRNYRSDEPNSYYMRVEAKNTQGLDDLLRDGFPMMKINSGAAPFEVKYWISAPTAANWPIGTPDGQGRNAHKPTFSEAVRVYLRERLSINQKDWIPPETVPIVESGTIRIADDEPQGQR